MTTLGRHPDALAVKLTLGDGAHLVASTVNGWAGPVTLHYGPRIGDPVISDVGTVDGDEVSWTLTEGQVEARAEHGWVRLEDNGVTLAAGRVLVWSGGLGSTTTQTIASLTAGPPGPTAVSADADNVATLGTDGLIYVSPADSGAFSDAAVAAFVDDTGSSTYASILAGFAATDDPRLSDARTPTAHTHDDRYFTEAEVTAALALKSDTGHGHVINDVTGLQAALDGKQAAGSYAAASHTHGVTDLTATGTKDATTFLRGDNTWAVPAGGGGGVTDHGALTGLGDDDHTQYALADGSRGSFAATSHTHVIADTTGLQTALDGKAASSHTHTLSQVTDAGDSAGLDVGTTAGTVAAGDHLHDARYVTVVEHGAVAGTARPAGATVVLWIGSVEPTNAVAGDQWDDGAGSPTVYIEEPASDGTNGQVLTTDGAGGRTWTTVSSGLTEVTAANVDSEAATDGYVLTADGAGGAAWEAAAGGGSDPWTYYVLSGDASTTSATLGNIAGLSVPSGLTAGSYEVRAFIYGTHSGGGGYGYFIPSPTGGDLRGSQNIWRGAAEGNAFSMMHAEATSNAGVSYVGMHYEARAVITVASSTSSAVNVQHRSITGGSTTTAKPGSYLAIRKIA